MGLRKVAGIPQFQSVDLAGKLLGTAANPLYVSGGGSGGTAPSGTTGTTFPSAVSPIGVRSSTGNLVAITLAANGSLYTSDTRLPTDLTTLNTTHNGSEPGLVVRVVGSSQDSSNTSNVSSVAAAVTNTTLLAANANRVGAVIYNTSTSWLFIKLGTGANTTNSFTGKVPPEGYYEVPFKWKGQIDGIWTAANGAAQVTELT